MRVSQDMTERGEPIIAKNVQESCFSRWVCVYPAYLNSRKTVQQGRRISKSRAIENPTCPEIKDVCLSQKSATRHMIVELTPTHTHTHTHTQYECRAGAKELPKRTAKRPDSFWQGQSSTGERRRQLLQRNNPNKSVVDDLTIM